MLPLRCQIISWHSGTYVICLAFSTSQSVRSLGACVSATEIDRAAYDYQDGARTRGRIRDASVCAAMKEEAAEGKCCDTHGVRPHFSPLRFFVVTQVCAQLEEDCCTRTCVTGGLPRRSQVRRLMPRASHGFVRLADCAR